MADRGTGLVNVLIRGVRVIDPAQQLDEIATDVRIEDGRVRAIGRHLDAGPLPVLDMTPADGRSWRVVSPGFIDLHAHLREPGEGESVASGARAAAAGGFTNVLAMANTRPPIDTPQRVAEAVKRARDAIVAVHTVAAVTDDLEGTRAVDIEACASAGAVAFSDDGRNALLPAVLIDALRRAEAVGRPVLVHPENEAAVGAGIDTTAVVRSPQRPPEVEVAAVRTALAALRKAGAGHLHLQHVSTAASVELVRRAKQDGLQVTAEATPHHLGMWVPVADQPMRDPMLKVNPPLRTHDDRDALLSALREGLIDAIATDHAPHPAAEKSRPYAYAAPGMIGLESALAACLTLADLDGEWLPTLVSRLTIGPHGVVAHMQPTPSLRAGEPASLVLFDPHEEWNVEAGSLHSQSHNTPLLGSVLRGRVLLTIHASRVVHRDARLPAEMLEPAHV